MDNSERIIVKFYRVHEYTDETEKVKTTFEVEITEDNLLLGKLTLSCSFLPDVVIGLGILDPSDINQFEENLEREFNNGRIKNLIFKEEVIGVGVRIHTSPQQIRMN